MNMFNRNWITLVLFLLSFHCAQAQVDLVEYFFDTDPGLGNGEIVDVSDASDATVNISNIDITGLEQGLHIMYARSKDVNGVWSLTQKQLILRSQTPPLIDEVTEIEYYFDTDPGIGQANPISLTSASDISNLSATISTNGLTPGLHRLHIRSKGTNGQWSLARSHTVFFDASSGSLQDIEQVEYYFDTDPGLGLAYAISITPNTDLDNLTTSIDISGLDAGIHFLYIRSRDAQNRWSLVNQKIITINNASNASGDIVMAEYYVDTDPGFGQGSPLSLTPDMDIAALNRTISTTGLSQGIHMLMLRTKDEYGRWSLTRGYPFLLSSGSIENITALEYYFDTDPGYGQAQPIAVSEAQDINNINATISTSGLTKGIHKFFVRSRNSKGEWSLINSKAIFLSPAQVLDIVEMEYFIDTDPGIGQGTAVSLASMSDINKLTQAIDLTGLDYGAHILYLRSKDENGKWSLGYQKAFYYQDGRIGDIEKLEYYVDTDPGIGNATEVQNMTNLTADLSFEVSGLDDGVHALGVRSYNDTGEWSVTNIKPFYQKDSTRTLIERAEYFIDSDPGIGQATQITLPQLLDLANHSFLVMVPNNPGEFDLYVRTRTTDNKWSLTHIVPDINFDDSALPLNWISFDVSKMNDSAQLSWKVAEAVNTDYFNVQHLDNGQFSNIARVESEDALEVKSYQYVHDTPLIGWNTYRIQQLDRDGQESFSQVRMVYFDKSGFIQVFPNPTMDKINIKGDTEYDSYLLLDASGAKIKTGMVHQSSIDCEDLPSGAYTLMVLKKGTVVSRLTIVKL